MGLFDWLFGREEEPGPEARRRKTEEEFYDHSVEVEEAKLGAEHSWQMMQQARERLWQRRAQKRRWW